MPDIIQGPVTRIIDGDTFEMRVDKTRKDNTYSYNTFEIIRIANRDAPELGTSKGLEAKRELERILDNKIVSCTVQARDSYGRVVVDVTDVCFIN